MAKCIHCDYPYASGASCPNCGSTDPQGTALKTLGQIVVAGVLLLACVGFYTKDDEPSIAKTTSASPPEKAASTPIKPASTAPPLSKQFFGIGIVFARQRIGVRDQLIIQAITPDSPASKNPSIRVGQHVLSINNVTTNFKSVEDCVKLVRMKDPVVIEIQTSSTSASSFSIDKANFDIGQGHLAE